MPEPAFRDPALEAEFRTSGFVRIRLFDADEICEIDRRLGAVLPSAPSPNHLSIYSNVLDAQAGRRTALAELAWEFLGPALARHIAGGRLRTSGVVVKPAGGGALPIHHHGPFIDRPFERAIVCWCPLIDTGPDTAGLRVVRRSHQILPYIRTHDRRDYFHSFRGALSKYWEDLEAEAGEAILIETTLLHGSTENAGNRDRSALTCMLVPDESRNAIFLETDDDMLEVLETGDDPAYAMYASTRTVSPAWRRLRLMPNRSRTITEAEFVRLIALGARADEDHDPLDALRGAAADGVRPRSAGSGLGQWMRGLAAGVRRRMA